MLVLRIDKAVGDFAVVGLLMEGVAVTEVEIVVVG